MPVPCEQTIARPETALQQVLAPAANVDTGDVEEADARAGVAGNAKAQVGLMLLMVEGLIRASVRQREKGIGHAASVVHNAWVRWLQLGGRRAEIEVPMDGWLVEEFPPEWLQPGSSYANVLAMTSSIGRPPSLRDHGELPSCFFEPLRPCHLGWAENDLRRDLAALLCVSTIVEAPSEAVQVPVELRSVADTLFRDLHLTMQGGPVGGWDRYPGY